MHSLSWILACARMTGYKEPGLVDQSSFFIGLIGFSNIGPGSKNLEALS